MITTSIAKNSCDFSQIVMNHPSMNFQFLYIVFTMKIAGDLAVKPGFIGGLLEMEKLLLELVLPCQSTVYSSRVLHDHIFTTSSSK